ncbi:targeting protein for Xklp2 homolog [Glossina fuscipes]|uniref:Targeting protein for Xklp2 homolog n=1 Tax=Glossina fuscipes TaxID=7396 RepID=A0A9C6DIS9_9MUSC|nr:targeting protein for Xklp2 homolog [Glossina fuscipes]
MFANENKENHVEGTTDETLIKLPSSGLVQEWTPAKDVITSAKGAIPKNNPPTPQAYKALAKYKKKREEAESRLAEEEQKKREFHAKPMPNFKTCHQKLDEQVVIHYVTVPLTPKVLKHSQEAQEKFKKKLENLKREEDELRKFQSRPATVLKTKPFIPEKSDVAVEQCPFNLSMERRLQERKQYDEALRRRQEERQKQEEDDRKRLEEEFVEEFRKATLFKAQPYSRDRDMDETT